MSTVIPFYSRSSLHVDIYDRLHASQEDVAFYLRCARDVGHRVLELGVGTGRVAIPLATAGLDVTGVDGSGAMLSLAKQKARIIPKEVRARLHLRQGDIASLRVRGEFDLAFAAFRVFMSLLTPESQRRALQAVHRRLRPGGLAVGPPKCEIR